jgi:hypothetical protein
MLTIPKTLRAWIAVIVGVGHLGCMPAVLPFVAGLLMSDGHEHSLQVVEHCGHLDVVYHHEEHHEGESALAGQTEDDHHSHVLHLTAPSLAHLATTIDCGAEHQTSGISVCDAYPVSLTWAGRELHCRAPPPPLNASSALAEIRTIVLRV